MSRSASPEPASVPLPQAVSQRWIAYAVAAGAGILTASQPASAGIIYTPADVYFTSGTVFIDLNHDGVNDFKFTVFGQSGSVFQTLKVSGNGNRGAGVVGKGGSAGVLAMGAVIGPHDAFLNAKSASQLMAQVFANPTSTRTSFRGKWGDSTDKFLGLRFAINGQAHYGWAEFDVLGYVNIFGQAYLDTTLLGYAYDTVPNQALIAGKTIPAVPATTPEPGTLGLLALGSLGLAAWRKRKRESLD
jgi:PEP-CTERM motif